MTGKVRVLIVEDEWLIADDAAAYLRKAGHQVVGPVSSVTAALHLVGEGGIDAALLDIQLNEETSYPIAEALRTRGVPFAFLSGYGEREIPAGFRTCRIVQKPASQSAILNAVDELARAG
ncbi:response regulator [Mesorhizobium sp. M0119]|uniref:response regulator n=1 Tax=unclassified Mesorhizobium TaxID=325217 RepID=UPI00333AAF5C